MLLFVVAFSVIVDGFCFKFYLEKGKEVPCIKQVVEKTLVILYTVNFFHSLLTMLMLLSCCWFGVPTIFSLMLKPRN